MEYSIFYSKLTLKLGDVELTSLLLWTAHSLQCGLTSGTLLYVCAILLYVFYFSFPYFVYSL